MRHGGWSALYRSNIERKAKLIGHRRSAVNLSYYSLHRDDFDPNDEIHAFMHFYAHNWESFRSSWAQDAFVSYPISKSLAERHKKDTELTYLEIGGWDGVTSSNTLSLLGSKKWKGMLVEPDPFAFQKLKFYRSSDITINAAVVPSSHEGDLVTLERHDMLSFISGTSTSSDKSSSASRGKHKVKAMYINQIISKLNHVDYFSSDIEGLEYDILGDLDFENCAPDILTVECNWDCETESKIETLLKSKGYLRRFAAHTWLTRGDSWYCKSDMTNPIK